MNRRKIIGVGELLWDLLPGGPSLGGAPANFAYITRLLGDESIVASRVGKDTLGQQALGRMQQLGLSISGVQVDSSNPTGTVKVEIDPQGQAKFEIAHPVAWDFLEWTPAWQQFATESDGICFGSLAQRSLQSQTTIRYVLNAAIEPTKVFDVNLRQSYYSQETISESMKLADIVKLNDEELPKIMALFGLPHKDERSSAEDLLKTYDLDLVCITRGGRGSLLVTRNGLDEHAGFHVKVADTVGAGDAFTAALLHEFLNESPLRTMNDTANRVGAWVASQPGGMPVPADGLANSLTEVTRK